MFKELNPDRKSIDISAMVCMFECFAIKYMSGGKECVVIMEQKQHLADGTYLYVAYYESCEVDIMCVSGTDTFKDRFNLYINNAEGTIWGCDIVNIECDIDYRLW